MMSEGEYQEYYGDDNIGEDTDMTEIKTPKHKYIMCVTLIRRKVWECKIDFGEFAISARAGTRYAVIQKAEKLAEKLWEGSNGN